MKRRWGKDKRDQGDPKQFAIDWSASKDVMPSPTDSMPAVVAGIVEEPVLPASSKTNEKPAPKPRVRHRGNGVVARLPVPKPLPVSVAAGRFGYEEDGAPVHPGAAEVRAITDNQADKLIDMLDALVSSPGKPALLSVLPDAFESILTAYAQDFGEQAARQLQAYARRQASLEDSDRADRVWHR